MKVTTSRRLAGLLWIVSLSLVAVDVGFMIISSRFDEWVIVPMGLLNATIGLLVVRRQPGNKVGWAFAAAGLLASLLGFCLGYTVASYVVGPPLPGAAAAASLADWGWLGPVTIGTIVIPQIFPEGRLISRPWRVVLIAGLVFAGIVALGSILDPNPIEPIVGYPIPSPYGIEGALGNLMASIANLAVFPFILSIIGAATSVGVRFRRSTGVERQQLKWLAYAAGLTGLLMILMGPFWETRTGQALGPSIFLLIPLGAGIAILRHRLYDIDVVINKTVVYGILAVFISGIYGLLVIAPAIAVFGLDSANVLLPLMATLIIAALFQPLRRRAQRFANRLVYGQRATPYEAMADFSHRMAGALSLDEVLPRMAEAAARGVAAERSRVTVLLADGERRSTVWPAGDGEASFGTSLPVTHRGEAIGQIDIAKSPRDPLTPAEEKLLADLASQAGPALRNVRLNEELRASRSRIVAAQDQERQRMERDIHDGAQQQLVSLAVKVSLARSLVTRDPQKSAEIMDQIKAETDDAVESIRDLARGLFPPLLSEKGLIAAINSHVLKMRLPANVEGPGDEVRFDPTAEAAAYFVITEALQNASKHAANAAISVSLAHRDGQLEFSVRDEGPGFDRSQIQAGLGLQNMADRLEALGGTFRITSARGRGTTIDGSLPATPLQVAPD